MAESSTTTPESQSEEKPKKSIVKSIAVLILVIVFGGMLLRNYLFEPEMYNTHGITMGTTDYHVIVCAESAWGWERTSVAVENELKRIDQMMSTFLATSEVSKFNENPSTDWISVSPEMVDLVKLSKEASQTVEGKFDITIGPLIDLWGFGKKQKTLAAPPAPGDIAMVQSFSGLDKLECRDKPPALKKSVPELRIDLSGIAKGYGVDRVAAVLEKRGYKNYMIEVGGEARTKGHKVDMQKTTGFWSFLSSEKKNEPWVIGIKRPIPEGLFEQPIIELRSNLNDHAMATSGDVYNTHEIGGRHYTHMIDPVSGDAMQSSGGSTGAEGEEIGSVSVIASSCAEADALATGFYLLGVNQGIAKANANDLAVVYIIRTGDPHSPIRVVMSDAYKKSFHIP